MLKIIVAGISIAWVASASAQNMTPKSIESAATVMGRSIPVTPGDIVDRPYQVLGPVRASVEKSWGLGKPVSEDRVYRELWKRAARMGADAVISAEYTIPEKKFGGIIGTRQAWGKAIKFLPVNSAVRQ